MLASASKASLSSPHPLPRQAGICPAHLPHSTVPVKLHTALAWLPQWVLSPYAGLLWAPGRGEWGISKCGSLEDSETPLCCFGVWYSGVGSGLVSKGDGGWGAEFLQRTTDALNHGAGPVILLRRVQMGKLNNSWVLRHPKSGQCVVGRKPRGTEEGTGRCCWEPVRSGPVITKPGAPRFVGDLEKSRFKRPFKIICKTYWVCALLQTRDQKNNQ